AVGIGVQQRHTVRVRVCPQCGSVYTGSLTRCTLDDARIIDQEADPLVGRQLDRYHIEERLGVGGMGCVYSARHAVIDRSYAIKVLFGDYANHKKFQARFKREATSISKIRHPNIVQVEDFGRTPQGLTFLAMELVRGQTLQSLIAQKGRLKPKEAASIARQIADGLWAAHQLGFVHRDVKPANIMLAPTPHPNFVKLLDFGAVSLRSTRPVERLTAVGHIIGTPTYMAPEQVKNAHVPPSADVYALGVIMFEMLTGKPPFDGRHPTAVLVQHLTVPPPRAPSCRGLGQLIGWMLQKDPNQRPQSMGEVLEALDQLDLDGDASNIAMPADAAFYAAPTNQVSLGAARSELQALYAKLDEEADDLSEAAGHPEATTPDGHNPTDPDAPIAQLTASSLSTDEPSSWGTWINEFAGLDVPPTTELDPHSGLDERSVIRLNPRRETDSKPAEERALKTVVVRQRISPIAAAPLAPVAISAEGAPPTQVSSAIVLPYHRPDTPIFAMAPDATQIEIDPTPESMRSDDRSYEHELVYPVTTREEDTEADEHGHASRPPIITAPVPHLYVGHSRPARSLPAPTAPLVRPVPARPSVRVRASSPRWHYVAAGILLVAMATLGYAIAYGPARVAPRAIPAAIPR
ncbi:MAG: protein kinase, partial [Myxococcota bacterium]